MKPELSLPERPSALYLLAVLDLLVLLLVFFSLVPSVAQQAGVVIDRFETTSRPSDLDPAKVTSLTLVPGAVPKIFMRTGEGIREVALADLTSELTRQREQSGIEWAYLVPDKRVAVDLMIRVTAAVHAADLDVILGGTLPRQQEE